MPRSPRIDIADYYYHVINRANGRAQIFNSPADYQTFVDILKETVVMVDMRLVAYCLMPNHWHLILQPKSDGDLARFMLRLTNTHVKKYQSQHSLVGMGHVYQGRYKSFVIEEGSHFYTVLRYVERNALRAKLCRRAEDWQWGSAYLRANHRAEWLSALPIDLSENYLRDLNTPMTASEYEAVEKSEKRSLPFGSTAWQEELAIQQEQKREKKKEKDE